MQSSEIDNFEFLFSGAAKPEDLDISELIKIIKSHQLITTRAINFLHGGRTTSKISITHVTRGSIDIGSAIQIIGSLQPAFAMLPSLSLGATSVIDLIKSWFDILKFLKGRPPSKIIQKGDGQNLIIQNEKGDNYTVNGNVYNTFIMADIGHLANPYQIPFKSGAKNLKLRQSNRVIGEYTADDVSNFASIRPQSEAVISEIDAILSVVSPVFEGDGVWKFRYGSSILTAKIIDNDFRGRVLDGSETFKRGDYLRTRLKTEQKQVGNKLITSHYITNVVR
jgi:hypothetical protein